MPTEEMLPQDMIRCDVLIIGAGPAGSAAAQAAATMGAEVVVIDRRPRIGSPARCAGFIPLAAFRPSRHPTAVAVQQIDKMLVHCCRGGRFEAREPGYAPGYIINREMLDMSMAKAAALAGARIITAARSIGQQEDAMLVKTANSILKIESPAVIGADGPGSQTGMSIGSVNRQIVSGVQWTVPLKTPSRSIRIYLHRRLAGGYGWLFPNGDTAHAGIGVTAGIGLKPVKLLEWFIARLARQGLIEARRLSATGGAIPIGGLLPAHKGRVLLAGDAAGLCHPLTGAGLALAIQSGGLAGAAAAQFAAGEAGALSDYRREIEDVMAQPINRALLRRKRLYEASQGSEQEFCRAVENAWSVFSS